MARGEVARIDDIDVVIVRRRKAGVLIAAGKIGGDRDVDHEVRLAGVFGENLYIVRQIDRRRCGKVAARRHMRVDVVRMDVHAVAEGLVAELDVQRHEMDVIFFDLLRAEVAGAVRNDLIGHKNRLSNGPQCG